MIRTSIFNEELKIKLIHLLKRQSRLYLFGPKRQFKFFKYVQQIRLLSLRIKRIVERGITKKIVVKALKEVIKYYYPKYQSIILFLKYGIRTGSNVGVVSVPGTNTIKTIMNGKILKPRYIKVK